MLASELLKRDDLTEIAKQLSDGNDSRRSLINRKARIETTLANAIKALETNYSEAIVQKIIEAEREKKEVERALEVECRKKVVITEEDICKSAKKFAKFLLESREPAVREYLLKTVKEIIVGKDTVKFEFNIA